MPLYFSTTANPLSGESDQIHELAETAKAEVVHDVPTDGNLLYMLNSNIRSGLDDLGALSRRDGFTAFLIGVCPPWDEQELWRPFYSQISKIGKSFFVHHSNQIEYLKAYGIPATFVPANRPSYNGHDIFTPNTVLYSGFYWSEKNIPMIEQVAKLMPDWEFTVHMPGGGMEARGGNIKIDMNFVKREEYPGYLAKHEIIWIPRIESRCVYAGGSGISAALSGRPTYLTDVSHNDVVSPHIVCKYPEKSTASEIAEILCIRDIFDHRSPYLLSATRKHFSSINVWKLIKTEMERKGACFD